MDPKQPRKLDFKRPYSLSLIAHIANLDPTPLRTPRHHPTWFEFWSVVLIGASALLWALS